MAPKKRATRRPTVEGNAGRLVPEHVDQEPSAEHGDVGVTGEQTADYRRCGGHVLTDYGWVPERQ